MNIDLKWVGCFCENVLSINLVYGGNEFRILVTTKFNDEPEFYPQYIDENDGAIDFVNQPAYTYDECIELIKNFSK